MFDIMNTPFMHGVLTSMLGYVGFFAFMACVVTLSRKVRNVRNLGKK